MIVPFRKMHGLGNDFLVLDARDGPLPLSAARAAALADRRRGVGFDQLVVIEPGGEGAEALLRFRNPDGAEAGACGNATRCVAALLMEESGRDEVAMRSVAGPLPARRLPDGRILADMGPPRLGWREVPLSREADTLALPLSLGPLSAPAACSMGNPHATFLVENLDALDVAALGAALERDPIFPEGANIGFAQVLAPDRLRLAVWERGAGLTLACGSAACAALVNAARRGATGRAAEVVLPGGPLHVAWREDGHVEMTGPSALAYSGMLDLDDYPG